MIIIGAGHSPSKTHNGNTLFCAFEVRLNVVVLLDHCPEWERVRRSRSFDRRCSYYFRFSPPSTTAGFIGERVRSPENCRNIIDTRRSYKSKLSQQIINLGVRSLSSGHEAEKGKGIRRALRENDSKSPARSIPLLFSYQNGLLPV